MGSSGRSRNEARRRTRRTDWLRVAAPLVVCVALAILWGVTPTGRDLGADLQGWVGRLRDLPAAAVLVVVVFVAAGLLMVPLSLLILGTVLGFGAWPGGAYAMAGALASAATAFWIGRLLGRASVRRLLGGRTEVVGTWLERRGVVTVAIIRSMPVAPYTVVNVIAGASHLRLLDFLAGTFVGLIPGVVAFAVFGEGIASFVSKPSIEGAAILLAVIAAMVLLAGGVGRLVARFHGDNE